MQALLHDQTSSKAFLRPPRGSLKLIFTKLMNHVSSDQCHHKPMGMYGGGLIEEMRPTCPLVPP